MKNNFIPFNKNDFFFYFSREETLELGLNIERGTVQRRLNEPFDSKTIRIYRHERRKSKNIANVPANDKFVIMKLYCWMLISSYRFSYADEYLIR